jgi:hypothetical protein
MDGGGNVGRGGEDRGGGGELEDWDLGRGMGWCLGF